MPGNKKCDWWRVLGLAVLLTLSATGVTAESQPAPSVVPGQSDQPAPLADRLKTTKTLTPPAAGSREVHPVFVSAEKIRGVNDNEMVAEGQVEMRQFLTKLDADRVTYWQAEDEAEAVGSVRLRRDKDSFFGPRLRLKLQDDTGFFEAPHYSIARKIAVEPEYVAGAPELSAAQTRTSIFSGQAERADFEGKDHYRMSHATFSSCKPSSTDGKQDWYADVGELKLDFEQSLGEARDAKIVFRDVPILYSPWLSFSLNDRRKSGLLTPTVGSTNKSGLEFTLPYYWNIAPNMDATISPRVMLKRGTQWSEEFRYLEPTMSGTAEVEYLPNDRVTQTDRTAVSLTHSQNFGGGFSGALNFSRVSDDTYFSDLSTRIANTSQGNLLRQATLSYGASWWNAGATVQRYQTLQDPSLPPVGIPYRLQPQLSLSAMRSDLPLATVFNFSSEYVNFDHPTNDIGQRAFLYPQLSLPLQTAAFYVTPKVGVNITHYALDRRTTTGPDAIGREVPILSIDSGLVMERPAEWNGRSLTQTLEPRLFYVYIPARDQSQIPVFDTATTDFNFAQIFSENRYSGNDRIGDANQLTAAVTSRFIDPVTGAELLRGAIGQRYYFDTQQVTLPGEVPRTNRKTDVLAALTGQLWARTFLDAGWDYNQAARQTERLNIGGRYQPEQGKVLNASYRYTRDQLSQIDVSAQWPVWRGWHGVGRYNYSVLDHHVIESIAGIEYDGGCWTARLVVQRLATATAAVSSSLFWQLELNDFSRIGSNPLDILKRGISGYGRISQPAADPSLGAE